jgi:hypothetical protein
MPVTALGSDLRRYAKAIQKKPGTPVHEGLMLEHCMEQRKP